jgi:Holliday junction resolvase RusA-like endonuclease
MKFSLCDINPKFLAANAEALRAQGVDVSKLGLVAKTAKLGQQAANGAADMALMMGAKKTRKTLAESRMEMANGKTITAKGEAKGAVRGLAGKQIGMIVSDDPMKLGEPVFIGADYASKPDETKKFLFIDEVAHWSGEPVKFTIPGTPMGKPRMTQRDKWAKRDVVLRYRDWADGARAAAPADLPARPLRVNWTAYLPMPASWSKKKRASHFGMLHRAKPDRDNIDKAVLDALWPDDSCISCGSIAKFWEDELGPRLEVEVFSS